MGDLLNVKNAYFVGMVTQIYLNELQKLNKAKSTDTEAEFLDLHLLISKGFVSFKTNEVAMILILTLLISRFWMVPFLMAFTFLNSSVC